MTKQGIMIQVDSEFADALDAAAQAEHQIRSVFIRAALAAHIGYTAPVNQRSTRRRKYASAQERADAAKKRAQHKAVAERAAFKAAEQGDTAEAMRIMQEYLKWKEENG